MTFNYQDKDYEFPTSLSKITLRQRIDFDKLYAKEIEELQSEVYQKDEDGNTIEPDEVDVIFMNISIAIKNFSFFTGIPLREVESSVSVDNVLNIYYNCFQSIYEQQNEVILEEGYLWNGEIWRIEQPKLTFESQITFNELIVSKQIAKQMHELGAGNWEAMPFLATIFLKRENEVFEESWLAADSKRVNMMYDLPMDIAIAIGFFLQISMNIFTKTSLFSEVEEAEKDRV